MPGETSGDGKKTDRVADTLRELILESEEWENDHQLPREKDLAKEHGVSRTTLRRALEVLVGEGLIDKGQGRPSRVSIREPAYRFVIQLYQQAGCQDDRVAEPPPTFIRTPEKATEQREWAPQAEVAVPLQFAALLGLEPRARMMARSMKLSIDGEPILTSTSYLPAELDGDEGWQDVEVGQLAVVGHEVRSEFLEDEHRMPTPTERTTLGMSKDVLLKIISHRCWVALPDRSARAGVIVLARKDRVRLRWYGTTSPGSQSE